MRKMRTYRKYLVETLADREEAIGYLKASLEEYQIHGNIAVFLLALRTAAEAQGGISDLAKQIDTAPETLLEILSSDDNPQLNTLETILNGLGYRFSIEPLENVHDAAFPSKPLSAR